MVLILSKQILIMFTLIAIGYLFFKKNMITIQGSADMGKVLLYLVIPVVIVNSFWIERTQEKTMELLYSILLSIVAMGLSVLIGYLFFGKKDGISAFSSAFSNAGFIGIPLVTAAVGNEGAFFVAMMIVMINALQWTVGVYMISKDKNAMSFKKILTNPIVISVVIGLFVYFLNIPQPAIITDLFSSIKGINTALAMLVSGTYLAKSDLLKMLTRKNTYIVSFVRLLVIPLIILGVFYVLPIGTLDIKLTLVIAAACPVGSNVAIFAQQYDKNYTEAVEQVCMSTLLCLFTLPLLVSIATMIL